MMTIIAVIYLWYLVFKLVKFIVLLPFNIIKLILK